MHGETPSFAVQLRCPWCVRGSRSARSPSTGGGRQLLTDLQFTLESDPAAGRQVLRIFLVGPITVTPHEGPEGRYFEYLGQGALDRLLSGRLAGESVKKPNATKLVPPG